MTRKSKMAAGGHLGFHPKLTISSYNTSFLGVSAPWGWPSRGGAVLYRLSPQLGEDPPLLRTRGYVILWENRGGSVGSTFDSGPMCCRFESHLRN